MADSSSTPVKRFEELDRAKLDRASIIGFAAEMGTLDIDPWKNYISYSEALSNCNLSDLGYFTTMNVFGGLYGYYYAARPVFFRQRALTVSLLLTSYAGFFCVTSRSKVRMLAERKQQAQWDREWTPPAPRYNH
ncbi:hypothetical protein BASA82_000442 [Batrachochytrium salamandrivorans]|nr:hypothetical protein BASA81_003435 [Batrachochytrium salamandrivorans]KAH9262484.1 hypothetical protein BASA82_000442 [Batrachochytrium salamandrivorans]